MKKCIHCNEDNKEGWFYCKSCGKKASESKFTTNLWMTSDLGKRTDVELSTQSMGDNIQKMRKNLGYAS
jgi:uncharacterized membrane protein YvbJ|tara:strand:- start:298 stop:504 length:207 start_codon:yes stop_codon:yes gene_type:complete